MNATTPKEWIFSAAEIRRLLASASVEPWLGSPFCRLPEATSDPAAPAPSSDGEVLAPLSRIAQPEVVFGAIIHPPKNAGYAWFYGHVSESHLALLAEESESRFRVTWPVPKSEFLDMFTAPLELEQPALPQETSLELDRPQLVTLAAITDLIQEDALVAWLNRLPAAPARFDAATLLQCAYRSLEGGDRRWMMQRLRFLVPFDLAPALDEISSGLDKLCQSGLLLLEGGRYALSQPLGLLCSLWGTCSGYGALSVRLRSPAHEPANWRHRHVALWRSSGSLWLLEFDALEHTEFNARLRAVDRRRIQDLLRSLLAASATPPAITTPPRPVAEKAPSAAPAPMASPSRAPAPKPTPPKTGPPPVPSAPAAHVPPPIPSSATVPPTCRACGTVFQSGASFCAKCGAPRPAPGRR